MAANFSKQKLLADVGQVNFGAAGSLFSSETAVTLASAATTLMPAGTWYVTGDGTALQVEYSPDSSSTWRQFYASGYGGFVDSDGYNWRLNNSASTAITCWYFTMAPG